MPIAYLVAAPLVGSMLTKHGRTGAVIGGVLLMIFSVICAQSGKLKDPKIFYWFSFLARLVQGVAVAVLRVVIQDIIVLEFPEN